jgi:hypothetical protein
VYAVPLSPPVVAEVHAPDAASLIEDLYAGAASAARLPVLAVREVIENLVHARFQDALVSILDGGRTLRVSDRGPGIPDKRLALQPGFSTADEEARSVVRGVGCGLPLAASLMAAEGGALEIDDNLGGGTVATLAAPQELAPPPPVPSPACSETARRLLALLVELESATPSTLAAELEAPLSECGRELVLLEHRGMVRREPDGLRRLTADGLALVGTLF